MVGLGLGLSSCGNDGTNLARQACSHVDRSISYLRQSEHQPDQTDANRLVQEAYVELRNALPIAANAAYDDGQWQALMTTISESNRVPEATLVSALTAQCQMAYQSPFQAPAKSIPPPPSSTP